jgi:hypothetical protein
MLNATLILRYLEKKLGYRFNDLEISPNDIIENIQTDSLETFSKYFPYVERHYIDVTKDRVEQYQNQYYLKTDLQVLAVKQVFLGNNFGDGGDPYATARYCPKHNNFFDIQLRNDMASLSTVPVTFNFIYPNRVEIYPSNYTKGKILTELHCVHSKDFSTIPLNMKDEFLKLCLYDTQEVLYQIRHRFANLQTAFGNIELFIDDLQSAPDKKDELIEKWRRNAYKSSKRKKLYIY